MDYYPDRYENAIVVLGGTDKRFKKRLEDAINNVYSKKKSSLLIITGQNIKSNDDIIKLLEGKDYVYENNSINTFDNAENVYYMIKSLNAAYNPFYDDKQRYFNNIKNVYVVTDTLHVPRARKYFKKVFNNEINLYFHKTPEDKREIYKKMIYEGSAYLISFLPRRYINIGKNIKNKYFNWL